MKKLCKSHVTQIRKVATKLSCKQKMDSTQIILSEANKTRMEVAERLLYKAMNILENIG